MTAVRGSLAVGLAGLTLFGSGSLVVVAPLLFWPNLDRSLSVGILGDEFAIPAVAMLAIWPLGLLSMISGMMVMLGRDPRPGLACAATWLGLGLLAAVAGSGPGLLLLGSLATLVLWRAARRGDAAPG